MRICKEWARHYLGTKGTLRKPWKPMENLCEAHGKPWVPTIHGYPWINMGTHGSLLETMAAHGKPMGIQVRPMGARVPIVNPWGPIGSH